MRLKARVVGLHVVYTETARRPTKTKTSEQRRPVTNFHFYLASDIEGQPLFTARNTRLADAFILGWAACREVVLTGEARGIRGSILLARKIPKAYTVSDEVEDEAE